MAKIGKMPILGNFPVFWGFWPPWGLPGTPQRGGFTSTPRGGALSPAGGGVLVPSPVQGPGEPRIGVRGVSPRGSVARPALPAVLLSRTSLLEDLGLTSRVHNITNNPGVSNPFGITQSHYLYPAGSPAPVTPTGRWRLNGAGAVPGPREGCPRDLGTPERVAGRAQGPAARG